MKIATNMAPTSKHGGQNGGGLKTPDLGRRKCGMPSFEEAHPSALRYLQEDPVTEWYD